MNKKTRAVAILLVAVMILSLAGGGAACAPRHQRGYSLSEENTPFESPRERRGALPLDPAHWQSVA